MADRVGFEPTRRFPVHTLSKRAPSATRPPVLTKRRDYSVSPLSGKRGAASSFAHSRFAGLASAASPLGDFDLDLGVRILFLAEDQIEGPGIDQKAGCLAGDEHRV